MKTYVKVTPIIGDTLGESVEYDGSPKVDLVETIEDYIDRRESRTADRKHQRYGVSRYPLAAPGCFTASTIEWRHADGSISTEVVAEYPVASLPLERRTQYPLALLRVAQAFARSYSHSWAAIELPASGRWIGALEFEKLCEELRQSKTWTPGLCNPGVEWDEYPDGSRLYWISHSTASGRTTWTIRTEPGDEYGAKVLVEAAISRPAGTVITIRADLMQVDHPGDPISFDRLAISATEERLDPHGGYREIDCAIFPRHMHAARFVLSTILELVGEDEMEVALQEILGRITVRDEADALAREIWSLEEKRIDIIDYEDRSRKAGVVDPFPVKPMDRRYGELPVATPASSGSQSVQKEIA